MKKTIILLSLFSLPAVWFLIRPGGFEPHDLHHLGDIYQMKRAIDSGQFPPRLGPDFLYGFGYPLFNYYYVLPFYLGAFFYTAFGSLMAALKTVFLVSALLSVYGMYLLLKEFFGKCASFFGALLYLYTPFRAVEIYVRGAVGEALAIAIFPWVLWAIHKTIKKPSPQNTSILAIIIAFLLLTHNYFFLLIAPFTLAFTLTVLFFESKKLQKLTHLLIAGILGLGLSAYWWLPAFLEYGLVNSITPFVIDDHFPFLKQLIVPSWGYGSSVWGPHDLISFQVGVMNLLMVAISAVLFYKLRHNINKSYIISALAVVFFLLTIYLMNIRSMFIWKLIPFTNFIQFPWRLLALTTFYTSFLAGFVIDRLRFKPFWVIAFIALGFILVNNYFRPAEVVNRSDDHYISRMFSNPQFSEDYLLLPRTSKQKPDFTFSGRFAMIDGQVIDETVYSPVSFAAQLVAYEDTIVEARVLNFPGWFLLADGQLVETFPGEPYGQMQFRLKEGTHTLRLYWAETRLRLLADFVSALSVVAIVVLCLKSRFSRATI